MEPEKMEATRGWVWARGCLPVARTRAEVGQGAGLAVDFKTVPCLPRTLLLCHRLGGSSPHCAPCAAGEVLHAWPAPLQRCSCGGAARQGEVSWLCLPHASRGPAPAQVRDKQPVATPRHCAARGHLSLVILWARCWASAGEEHPHLLALSSADECSRDRSPKWSLLGTTIVGWHCPFSLLSKKRWLRAGANRVGHTRATQGARRRVGCECQVWKSSGFP